MKTKQNTSDSKALKFVLLSKLWWQGKRELGSSLNKEYVMVSRNINIGENSFYKELIH